jgi:hypothetical protein
MMERYTYSDKIFISLFALLAILSSIVLLNDQILRSWSYGDQLVSDPIGVIMEKSNDVRSKMSAAPTWSTASNGEVVHDKQMVFTGDNSKALIKLDNGSFIELDPNTLVMITSEENNQEIELIKGAVGGSFKDTKVKYQDKELNVSSVSSRISIKEKKLNVTHYSQTAKVAATKGNVVQKVQAAPVVAKNIIRELNFKEVPRDFYYIGSESVKVDFSWLKKNIEGDILFTISRKEGAKVNVKAINVKDKNDYSIRLKKEGFYTVFLKSKKNPKIRTRSVTFRLKSIANEKIRIKKQYQKIKL